MSDDDNELKGHVLETQHQRLENDNTRTLPARIRLLEGMVENIDDRDLVYLAMTLVEGCGCCARFEVGDPDWRRLAKELVDRLEAVV